MPSSLDISSYPLALYAAFETLITMNKPTTFEFPDRKSLDRWRFKVYGLRRALAEHVEHPLSSEALKVTTQTDGLKLTLAHVDSTFNAVTHPN